MARTSVLILGAVLSGVLCITGGCVQGELTVVIVKNLAPEENCVLNPNKEGTGWSKGRIDARSAAGYHFTPLIINYATTTMGQPESQLTAFLEGAEVRLEVESGLFDDAELADLRSRSLLEFSQAFSAAVFPNGGLLATNFEIVPQPLLAAMQDNLADNGEFTSVKASIILYGTIGNRSFESREYVYWVDVCDGCLFNDLGACSSLDSGITIQTGGACNPLQDGIADCCTESGRLICPAEPSGGA